jgi:two-component system NarL family sensor kinase
VTSDEILSHNQQDLQRLTRELTILNSIAQALNREIDLDRALQSVLAQVAALFDLHTGWIFLVNPENGATYLAASHNLPPGLANEPERMAGDCYCLDTYQAGDLEGAANVSIIVCSRLSKLISGTGGLRFHASIPLYNQESKLGVLNVASADWSELSAEDLRLLYTVGDMLSIAIARAHLFARSAQLGAVEERNRLAREIHDTLAQGLSAITLQLETADALLESEPASTDGRDRTRSANVRTYVQQALKLARSNLDEARRSVLDLRAAPLEGRTLRTALAELAQSSTRPGQLRVRFKFSGDERPLPVHVEIGLYRIAQEALANVARHAQARHATILLTVLPDHTTLAVHDDGQGFDPDQIPPGRYGLIGLNERARLLGGELRLESQPGHGVRLEVGVPLANKPNKSDLL